MEQKNINSSNQIITLKDIASINPTSVLPDTFHYIDLESVKDGKFYNKKQKISKEEAPSRAQRVVVENDILFQTVRPYQKNHLFVSNQLNGEVASSGFTHIRVDANKASARYIFQLLHSSIFNQKVNLLCTGTSYPAITSISLASIPFRLPSLPEQEKIAEFLSALDDMITLQESKIELLDKQKKGYVQRIFSRELRFRDDNGNEYSEWENKRLDSFTNFRMGFTPDTKNDKFWKGDNDWLSIAGMNSKYISKGNKKISDSSLGNKKPFPADTLIMSFKLTLGRCAILRENVFTNEAICGFENNETFNNEYLYYALSNTDVASFGSQAVKGLTLNSENIGSIIVPFPSLSEQEKVANFLSTLDGQITLEKEKLTQLKLQKQGYMQRIFG